MDKIGQLVANLEGAAKSLSLEMRRLEEVNVVQRQELEHRDSVIAIYEERTRNLEADNVKLGHPATLFAANLKLEEEVRTLNEKLVAEYAAKKDLEYQLETVKMRNPNGVSRLDYDNLVKFVTTLQDRVQALETKKE